MTKAILHTAASSKSATGSSGIGFVLELEDGITYHGGSYIGETTTSATEYTALVWGLDNAVSAGVDELEIRLDDDMLVNQLNGEYRIKNEGLRPLYAQAQILFRRIGNVDVALVRHDQNELAQAIADESVDMHALLGDFLRRPAQRQTLFDLTSATDAFTPAPVLPSRAMEEYLRTGAVQDAYASIGLDAEDADDAADGEVVEEDGFQMAEAKPELEYVPVDDESTEIDGEEMSWEELEALTNPDGEEAPEEVEEMVSEPVRRTSEPSRSHAPFSFAETAAMIEQAFSDNNLFGLDSTEEEVDEDIEEAEEPLYDEDDDDTGLSDLAVDMAMFTNDLSVADNSLYEEEEPEVDESEDREPGEYDVIGKTVLVGVTGCIAAYKACEVVRSLQKAGARVKVVMTKNATRFVGAATFKALTREPVAVSLFDAPSDPVYHVSLAREADCMVLVPCTANVMAKLAHGVADDLLTTTVLALKDVPLVVAPAMNTAMWEADATRENIETLRRRGVDVVEPASGYLACGEEGAGKLADIDIIVHHVLRQASSKKDLEGMKVLITAGPTVEPIDPVRYLSNYSSGKTGYALARAAVRRGAQVTLVSGPVALPAPWGVDVVNVKTAREMFQACEDHFFDADIAVFAAAVCDFTPAHVYDDKIKRAKGEFSQIRLIENPDIIGTLAYRPHRACVVGFAAETSNVLVNAAKKLHAKHADLIVANDVSGELGFGTDDNKVWICGAYETEELPVLPKEILADRILDAALRVQGAE